MESSNMPTSKPGVVDLEKDVGQKLSDFKLICELGRGSYGVVNRVLCLTNNNEYVMKKINMKHIKLKNQKEALKEAQILKKLRHPNIIRYYNSFVDEDHLYIIMEYAEAGDLAALIKTHREKRQYFSEKQVWDFTWELCQAIDYIHNNNIIHRDIKTLNVFLSKDGHIKLGDLGVSKIVSNAASLQGTRVGTPLYLSPELVKQLPYDFKVDIWALGCVLYHLVTLEPPFSGDNLISLGYNIVHKAPKALSTAYSQRLSALIMKFLEKSPAARPKISETYDYFPSKYRAGNKDPNASNSIPSNANKIELHDNTAAKLLKVPDAEPKKEKGITAWASPDKKTAISSIPIRPATTSASVRPTVSSQENNGNSDRGDKRGYLGPTMASPLKLNTFVSPPKDKGRNSSPIKQTAAISSLLEGITGNDSNSLFSKRESQPQIQDQKAEKKQQFQQDTESTVENKPRTFQAVSNPIGNDSTLSVKQTKENDNNLKRYTKDAESNAIMEESAATDKKEIPKTFASQSMMVAVKAEQDPKKNASVILTTENKPKNDNDSEKEKAKEKEKVKEKEKEKEREKEKEKGKSAAANNQQIRPMTADARQIMMNPLIKSTSPRFKINTRLNQMPSLAVNLNKASSESTPALLLKGEDPTKKIQIREVLNEKNIVDNKKEDMSDSLETFEDLKKKPQAQSAAHGVRIRPVSAHILKNMHNNLNQVVNDDKAAAKMSSFAVEKAGENKALLANKMPTLGSSQAEEKDIKAHIIQNKQAAAERPRSAVFLGRLGPKPVQVNKEQIELVGTSKPILEAQNRPLSGSRYFMVKNAGMFAAPVGGVEFEKDKKSTSVRPAKTQLTKDDILKEEVEDLGIIDDDEEKSFNDEAFNKAKSSYGRFETRGKSATTNKMDLSKKIETAGDWMSKEDGFRAAYGAYGGSQALMRPVSAINTKKKLTIHDLM